MHGRMMAVALVIAVGCGGAEEVPAPEPAAEPVVTAPERTEPAPAVDDNEPARFAKVLEVMDSGGYTFARLDSCGMEAWAAGPPTPLEVGQSVSMPVGAVMTNFSSPTLGRSFDMILFVSWFRTIEASEMPSCEAPPEAGATNKPQHTARTGPPTEDEWAGTILETMNSGGYTYLRMKSCTEESMWVAAPKSRLAVGQPVAAWGGVPMRNFHSDTLDKDFESILFAQSIRVLSQPVSCE
jgi:hypothetical protein